MNRELLALFVHDVKNQLGVLEAELSLLEAAPDRPRAHRAHQHCAQLRQRLIAYLTLYGSADKHLYAQCADESPQEFLNKLLRVDSRPDGAPLRIAQPLMAPPFWYFDARLVLLAMEAALHNAWRFARSDVCLDARAVNGFLVLSVEDDGGGLGCADPSAQSSTGLGMELCAAVARAHQLSDRPGRVRLTGRPQGTGTRFEIWLP
ncbi:sensor histidine kinase [Roseateles sp.]|uniref:sensor histidine kinase n=1 Tax=Roseateles sp. TaxID=1971397 RepID=UPI003BA4E004